MTLSPDQVVVRCSPSEIDVLRELVRSGGDNLYIAGRLGLSHNTIKTHMLRVNRRVKARNRTALALAIVRSQVVVVNLQGRVVEF